MKQTAVEFAVEKLEKFIPSGNQIAIEAIFDQAKEMEKEQKNNMPIHIHEGISNTWVYIEDGVVHVKPNDKNMEVTNE